jgi:hypothetical protein
LLGRVTFGGGVCVSKGLSAAGEAEAAEAGGRSWNKSEEGVIIFSAFDGIGGAFQAWHLWGLEVALRVSAEVDAVAQRVARVAWPDLLEVGDITAVGEEQVHQIVGRAPRAEHIFSLAVSLARTLVN